MKARRPRAAHLARSVAKLAAVGALAGGVGLAVGLGLSHLSGSTIASPARPARPATTGGAATATVPAPAAHASSPPGFRLVKVRVLSVVLHPAATPAGRQRQRARLIVRIAARNDGPRRVTPSRPVLIAGDAPTRTDPHADAPGIRFGPIAAGATETVALQFEVAGAVTAQLTGPGKARIFLLGRSVPIAVKVGAPVGAGP